MERVNKKYLGTTWENGYGKIVVDEVTEAQFPFIKFIHMEFLLETVCDTCHRVKCVCKKSKLDVNK